MARFEITTPPASLPLDLDDVKAHLRHFRDDENDLITQYIGEATRTIEDDLKHVFIHTGIAEYHDAFPPGINDIELLFGPIHIATEIVYYDSNNNPQTYDSTHWEPVPNSWPGRLRLKYDNRWPTDVRRWPDSVYVQYTAGWGANESELDERLKGLLRKYVGHLWENREAETTEKQMFLESWSKEMWALTARNLV